MTTVRQLYEIQELDLELTQARDTVSSIDGELGNREHIDALRESIETQTLASKRCGPGRGHSSWMPIR